MLLRAFLVFAVLDVPLCWNKVAGGQALKWVGYELLLKEASLRITASRSAWLRAWMMKLVADKTARVGTFSEGLERAACVYGALEYDRPFLAQ